MPIRAQFTWSETEKVILLNIPLKGTSPKKVDIFATELFLKVNFPPYLLLLDLSKPVNDLQIRAKVNNGVLVITMNKKTEGLWGNLEIEDEKKQKQERRRKAEEEKMERDSQLRSKIVETRIFNERQSVRNQMELESSERKHLEELKTEEKKKAEEEIYRTFARMRDEESKNNPSKSKSTSIIESQPKYTIPDSLESNDDPDDIWDSVLCDDVEDFDTYDVTNDASNQEPASLKCSTEDFQQDSQIEQGTEIQFIPPPRKSANVKISFTPRVFPSAKRESTAVSEQEWLIRNGPYLKNHEMFKNVKEQSDRASLVEMDPVWLKGKGDDFFRSGDIESAISAYTSAIELKSDFVQCYSNRAACYLKLFRPENSAEDCTTALNLVQQPGRFDPEPQKTVQLRLHLLIRRGTALCQLGRLSEGLDDFNIACRLDPEDASLKIDRDRIEQLVECDIIKKNGDELYREKKFDSAEVKYSEALAIDPQFVSALSNRAACRLITKNYEGCIEDCTLAIELLKSGSATGPIPPIGSEKWKRWQVTTLVRRATAHMRQSEFNSANQDYSEALKYDPENVKLQSDLNTTHKLCQT